MACGLAAWAGTAWASFNGPLGPMDPKGAYVVAAVLALPTAIACVLSEAILPRRRMPLWLTGIATLAAVVMMVFVFGIGVFGASRTRASGGAELVWLWFAIPPVATLALRGLIPRQWTRLAVGVVISVLSVKLGAALYPGPESLPVLAGGATTCLLLWIATVLLLRAMRWTPPEGGTNATGSMSTLAAVLPPADYAWSDVGQRISAWFEASLSRRRGVGWWLATTIVLYLGIGAVISLGGLRGGLFMGGLVASVTELFGMPQLPYEPMRLWWTLGLPWSLLVASAAWGVAGVVGGFDPGRLRVLRLPAIVFGGLLLVWTAYIAWNIHVVWSAEEAASGIR